MIYYDSETTSLAGIMVLLQYSQGDKEVVLYPIWLRPIRDTLHLIEWMMDEGVIGFNLSFDHFHLSKIYNTFRLFSDPNELPINHIDKLGVLELQSRDGPCLKPRHVFDVMLHARKGPYQSTMDRGDIRIKKVPIKLKNIYFARRKKQYRKQWEVFEHKYVDGTIDPEFRDIVLKFNPSTALKALAIDALGVEEDNILLYDDVTIDPELYSNDIPYAPFALSVANDYYKTGNWKKAWPAVIRIHVDHWANNKLARNYAANDVIYTRDLYKYFGSPPMDDDDSILSCLVASCRLKGYRINIEGIQRLRDEAIKLAHSAPKAPAAVRDYIYSDLSNVERTVLLQDSKIVETTKKIVLEEISEFTEDCCCIEKTKPNPECKFCSGTGKDFHKAALKAQKVLEARLAQYEVNFYDKLLLAGRLYADFNIIGALSTRMSGTSGLNAQGIKKSKKVRSCFPLAFHPYILSCGDFISFEVVLADARYNDPDLRKALQTEINCPFCDGSKKCKECGGYGKIYTEGVSKFTCEECKGTGKCDECKGTGRHIQTIHGLFGTFMYPGMSYVDILRTKGTADDKYTRSKSGVFLNLYGGTEYAMEQRLGIPMEIAKSANERFFNRFKKIGIERTKIVNMCQAMRQPDGIGTRVEWHQPADYCESMFGFKRYFTLENMICKALFDLAEKPPEDWTKLKIKVTRRDREQSVSGAVRSALFAAAFNIQGQITRAFINHVIQSSGAQLTKGLQCAIWKLQPIKQQQQLLTN